MRNYLNTNWDLGIAFGEFASSMLLIFISFSLVLHFSKSKYGKVFSFAIAGLISIAIGWGIGSLISGRGHGISLISPITAFLLSFHYNAYAALWFIILFQFLGTAFGFGLYIIYKLFLYKEKTDYEVMTVSIKETAIKSSLFHPILITSMLFIPILDFTAYGTSLIWNSIILISSISTILLLTKNHNSIMFSPFISLFKLIDLLIDKKINKKYIHSLLIEFLIQLLVIIIIINIDIAILKHRGVY